MIEIEKIKTTGVILTPYEKGRMCTASNFVVHIYTSNEGVIEIIASKGFITDGASVPKFLQMFFAKYGGEKYAEAWLLHDIITASNVLTFKLNNAIFDYMLKRAGVSRIKRWLMVKAVNSKLGKHYYETQDEQDRQNEGKTSIRWNAK